MGQLIHSLDDTRPVAAFCGKPDEWRKEGRVFLFASLRSSVKTFGYVVMPYRADFFEKIKHRTFVESLALSLHNIDLRHVIEKYKEKE